MKVISKVGELRAILSEYKGKLVGFVPTMGALHEGHKSLFEICRKECDVAVVSIFVNPTQFNDKNDLKNYPRTLDNDLELLESVGVDIVFAPQEEDIYPEPDTRVFDFGRLDKVMEGAFRPGHFNGVAQVVSRLFDVVKPNRAYFGEKDFQQLAIICRMVKDMNLDIQIVPCPIVRAEDGLALSSRNALLSHSQRASAPNIYRVLKEAVGKVSQMSPMELKQWVIKEIDKDENLETEYFDLVDSSSLESISSWSDSESIRGCVAVKVSKVRLIDNIKFK